LYSFRKEIYDFDKLGQALMTKKKGFTNLHIHVVLSHIFPIDIFGMKTSTSQSTSFRHKKFS